MSAGLDTKQAWVVFTDQSELKFVRFLKRGFRHCFVLIHDGRRWVSIDPMANYMEVIIHEDVTENLDVIAFLKQRGHHVARACLSRNITTAAPVMLFTCVEACKRILGIHKRSILTPWQLYRHLSKKELKTWEA
ncbi:MAG: hypothetical protein ACLFP8_06385 [Alphaproteobacteria bacterium]